MLHYYLLLAVPTDGRHVSSERILPMMMTRDLVIQQQEPHQASESVFVSGLQRRVDKIVKADELDAAMSLKDENNNIIIDMPVVIMDALLPNQRLTGSTTYPTFCNLLRSLFTFNTIYI